MFSRSFGVNWDEDCPVKLDFDEFWEFQYHKKPPELPDLENISVRGFAAKVSTCLFCFFPVLWLRSHGPGWSRGPFVSFLFSPLHLPHLHSSPSWTEQRSGSLISRVSGGQKTVGASKGTEQMDQVQVRNDMTPTAVPCRPGSACASGEGWWS